MSKLKAEPNIKYELGLFCPIAHMYMDDAPRYNSGFMKDFFDKVMTAEPRYIETAKHLESHKFSKTCIAAGVWEGTNKTDLCRFYTGERKIPQWKARDLAHNLDVQKVAGCFHKMSIDEVPGLQKDLLDAGIHPEAADDVAGVMGKWLMAILQYNARGKDIRTSNGAQLELDFGDYEEVPLANGHIIDGKLHLGHSSVPWLKPPAVPSVPDERLESVYTGQMLAAFADHQGSKSLDYNHLSARYQRQFDEQRGFFYDAEGVRRNFRDTVDQGADMFNNMKNDLYDGVCDVCEDDYEDGLKRMRTTLTHAGAFPLRSPIATFSGLIGASHKKGMCHMLVNDGRLEWVSTDD